MTDVRSSDGRCKQKLIQSYVQDYFFVSTAYRRSSAMLAPDLWYYETIVWNWNPETRERGEIVDSHDSGYSRRTALASHAEICASLAATLPEPERTND
jgi:hypothetical protein